MNKRICKSCGEPFTPQRRYAANLTPEQNKRFNAERLIRCEECAIEIATGQVVPFTLQHDAGGGRRVIRSTRGMGG